MAAARVAHLELAKARGENHHVRNAVGAVPLCNWFHVTNNLKQAIAPGRAQLRELRNGERYSICSANMADIKTQGDGKHIRQDRCHPSACVRPLLPGMAGTICI